MRQRHVVGRPYIPAVDGLRAVAVLSVILYHLDHGLLPGGFIGVDIFFVISGFVVTGSMTRDHALNLPAFLAAFYARRFRRIVPALVVCLLGTFLLSTLLVPASWVSTTSTDTGLAAFFGASNFVLVHAAGYFAPRSELNPFTHTWSLAVEEQFYLLFPLLIYPAIHAQNRRIADGCKLLVLALTALSLVHCAMVSVGHPRYAYFMLPSRFWELGVGASINFIDERHRETIIAWLTPLRSALLGLAGIAISMVWAEPVHFPFPWAIPGVFGTGFLIFAVTSDRDLPWLLKPLATRVAVNIGLLSYSLYLWHWPIFTLMRWTCGLGSLTTDIAAVAATFVAAAASYAYVEVPAQQFAGNRLGANRSVVFAGLASITMAAAIAWGVAGLNTTISLTKAMRNYAEWYPESDPVAAGAGPCSVTVTRHGAFHLSIVPTPCPGAAPNPGRMYVLGDSHAISYQHLFENVARERHVDVELMAKGGCPVAGLLQPDEADWPDCQMVRSTHLADVMAEAKPGDAIVLTSLRLAKLFDPNDDENMRQATSAATDHRIVVNAIAFDEAKMLVERLARTGAQIIFELPPPVMAAPVFRCVDVFNRANPDCAGGLTVPRATLLRYRAPIVDAIGQIGEGHANVTVWDPFPVLCPGAICPAMQGEHPLLFDDNHISSYGNSLVTPSFLRVYDAAMATRRSPGTAASL